MGKEIKLDRFKAFREVFIGWREIGLSYEDAAHLARFELIIKGILKKEVNSNGNQR